MGEGVSEVEGWRWGEGLPTGEEEQSSLCEMLFRRAQRTR